MSDPDTTLRALVEAMLAGESASAEKLLDTQPELVRLSFAAGATRRDAHPYALPEIEHYIYQGDTALHCMAAGYKADWVEALLTLGADVKAVNRRKATPLHYAVDGVPASERWDPDAQAATVVALLEGGAEPDCFDANGSTPLHRAIRNRCSVAVKLLLQAGACPSVENGRGHDALAIARASSGRGGTGSDQAKAEQVEILRLLERVST